MHTLQIIRSEVPSRDPGLIRNYDQAESRFL
jgi:hypothetical protein